MQKDLGDLKMRRTVCQAVIASLDKMEDPRQADAIKHYKAQLAEIDAMITKITGKPPAITVGLKTADLLGTADIK